MREQAIAKINEWGKRYQVDLAYIIKNEFWVYLRLGIGLIVGLATTVAFARLAPKEIYGQYNFILAILAIVTLASIPGLNNSVLRSVARGNDGNYKAGVKISFLWSLLGIPALLVVGAYYYYYNTQIIGICLMMSSIFFPFIYAPNTWDSFLVGKKRFDLTARYGSIQSVISAAAIIAILFLNANHLVLILATHLVTSSFLACLLYRRSLKYIENKTKDDECQKYGYFLTTASIVGTLANNIDKILIGILLGGPQLAIYAIGKAIPERIRMLLKPAWSPFMPKFSQDGVEMREVQGVAKKFILPLALVTLGGSLLYWFFIDDIMLLLFTSKYMESTIYAKMLLLMILASIPGAFLGTFAIAKRKTKAIIFGSHIFSFLRLAIMSGFIYQWGIMGAVWALNLNMVIHVLLISIGLRGEETPQEQQFEG